MSIFSPGDTIFATAIHHGREICNICSDSFTGFADLLSRIRHDNGSLTGLVTLRIRNTSQGRTDTRAFYLA